MLSIRIADVRSHRVLLRGILGFDRTLGEGTLLTAVDDRQENYKSATIVVYQNAKILSLWEGDPTNCEQLMERKSHHCRRTAGAQIDFAHPSLTS